MKTEIENQKIEKKEVKNSDSLNLGNVKVNVSKGKKELANKERIGGSRKELYIGIKNLSSDDQKKFRQKIRNQSKRFVSEILGKDRSDDQREKAIHQFLDFYKSNWSICDFKIENFSQSKNSVDLQDYIDLLEYVKETLE